MLVHKIKPEITSLQLVSNCRHHALVPLFLLSPILIEIAIHKPCTDNCSGLRIEPVTIEKHIDLAFQASF